MQTREETQKFLDRYAECSRRDITLTNRPVGFLLMRHKNKAEAIVPVTQDHHHPLGLLYTIRWEEHELVMWSEPKSTGRRVHIPVTKTAELGEWKLKLVMGITYQEAQKELHRLSAA